MLQNSGAGFHGVVTLQTRKPSIIVDIVKVNPLGAVPQLLLYADFLNQARAAFDASRLGVKLSSYKCCLGHRARFASQVADEVLWAVVCLIA